MCIRDSDKETLAFKAQGDSVLRGAVYVLYAKEDIVHPDGTTGAVSYTHLDVYKRQA